MSQYIVRFCKQTEEYQMYQILQISRSFILVVPFLINMEFSYRALKAVIKIALI